MKSGILHRPKLRGFTGMKRVSGVFFLSIGIVREPKRIAKCSSEAVVRERACP
jgi:hypothetical protein